jgi:Rps23 Pro-64 3,4-dihydroxylase Tpa1-like proline 4-hydroxylase
MLKDTDLQHFTERLKMNKIEYKKDIIVYEEFLTKDECDRIIQWLEFCVTIGKITWNQISFYESFAMGFYEEDETLELFGFPKDYIQQLKLKIQKQTEEAHNRKVKEVSYHAQKWIPGAFASFHSDNSSDGEYNAFEKSKIATFLYLNDDFDGGMLNFKDHPISIKPKVGMLSTFEGGHENEHEVQVVETKSRYTIGSFWDYAESVYSQEKLDKWKKEIDDLRAAQAVEQKEWVKMREKGERLSPDGDLNV